MYRFGEERGDANTPAHACENINSSLCDLILKPVGKYLPAEQVIKKKAQHNHNRNFISFWQRYQMTRF